MNNAKRFMSNTVWIIGGQIIKMLISLVVGALTARYLGPSNYGIINYVSAVMAFFTVLTRLGFDKIFSNEYFLNEGREGEFLGTVLLSQFVMSLISSVIFIGTIFLLKQDDKTTLIVAAIQSLSIVFGVGNSFQYYFLTRLESKYSVVATTTAFFVLSGIRILLLVLKTNIYWFSFASVVESLVLGAVFIFVYFRKKSPKLSFSKKMFSTSIKKSYHYIIASLMVTIYAEVDKIMLGSMMDNVAVGLYSAALGIVSLWAFFPNAIIDSAAPIILHKMAQGEKEQASKLIHTLSCIIWWLSILYGAFIVLIGKYLILLLYGESYLSAYNPLIIAVWYTIFSFLGRCKNIWLICNNLNSYEKWFTIIGGVFNIALNACLIPVIGVSGAAVATLATQLVTNIILPLFFKKTRLISVMLLKSFLFINIIKPKEIISLIKGKKSRSNNNKETLEKTADLDEKNDKIGQVESNSQDNMPYENKDISSLANDNNKENDNES